MPEPFSPEQLNQLRQRWERDPKSRAFLQLAEEYRRAGRLGDAIHVLRAGLKEHPNYLSAQVALGRCLVETDDARAAIEILERRGGARSHPARREQAAGRGLRRHGTGEPGA